MPGCRIPSLRVVPHSESMIEQLAAASVRHRSRTIVIWIAALVGVIVLGGMVTSTILTLVVIPILYNLWRSQQVATVARPIE